MTSPRVWKGTPGPWSVFGTQSRVNDFQTFGVTSDSQTSDVAVIDQNDSRRTPTEVQANAQGIAALPDLIAALVSVEWSDGGRCPSCQFEREAHRNPKGHSNTCALDAALRKAGV